MTDEPKIDGRNRKKIRDETIEIAPYYTDAWDPTTRDAGTTLVELFSGIAAEVVSRLDRMPEKHRVASLDMFAEREPPQPARLPLSVVLTDDAPENVAVPQGTIAVAEGTDGSEQLFEVIRGGGFEATPASIECVYSVDPANDDIFSHWPSLDSGQKTELFNGVDMQRHALYIGHTDLLNVRPDSRVVVFLETRSPKSLFDHLEWEFFGEKEIDGKKQTQWHKLSVRHLGEKSGANSDRASLSVSNDGGFLEVTSDASMLRFELEAAHEDTDDSTDTEETNSIGKGIGGTPIKKSISGTESRWLRCRFPSNEEQSVELTDIVRQELFAMRIHSVRLEILPGVEEENGLGFTPDDLLYNDVPLATSTTEDTATPIAPFGENPSSPDTFYIASEEAFTKRGFQVTLTFKHPLATQHGNGNQAAISFNDQLSNGRKIKIDSVTLPHGGFVAIYRLKANRRGRAEGEFIGVSEYLPPGTYSHDTISGPREISLDQGAKLDTDQWLRAKVHEAGPNNKFTTNNNPVVVNGKAVISDAYILIDDQPMLSWEYWNGSRWARIEDVVDKTAALTEPGSIVFTAPEDLTRVRVAGNERSWIRVRFLSGKYTRLVYQRTARNDDQDLEEWKTITRGAPPRFGTLKIRYDWKRNDEQNNDQESIDLPDAAHLITENNLSLSPDLNNNARSSIVPFLDSLDKEQTLYIGFNAPLRSGPINLLFSLLDKEYPDEFYPDIRWESYINVGSNQWKRLSVDDETEDLTKHGIISVTFPHQTATTSLFGHELHWLRARITGNQFRTGWVIGEIDIKRERIILENYSDNEVDLTGHQIVFNLEHSKNISQTLPPGSTLSPNSPLVIATGEKPHGYSDIQLRFQRGTLNMEEIDSIVICSPSGAVVAKKTDIRTSYTRETHLQREIRESSDLPSCDQLINMMGPAKAPRRSPPVLRGLYPNTSWADNAVTVSEEVLGSSDGTANQEFTLANSPASDIEVWVNEYTHLTKKERTELAESSPGFVEKRTIEEDKEEFWVQWIAINNLLRSAPTDRNYKRDRFSGLIIFGDGTNGRIPPRGEANIRATYTAGGGVNGNVDSGAVTGLQSALPYVEESTNPEPADTGSDAESTAAVLRRAPGQFRDRGRAVCAVDYERIAMASSRKLARTRCLSGMDRTGNARMGWVTVLIVPRVERGRPVPSIELKKQVKSDLRKRTPATVVDTDPERLVVRGPSYVDIAVSASIYTIRTGSLTALEARATRTVEQFLHPLSGGFDGEGWAFGELPCLSDLYALLRAVEGVEYVDDLSMTFTGNIHEQITVTEGESLPQVSPDVLIFGVPPKIKARRATLLGEEE
jgi:hypothetical protein